MEKLYPTKYEDYYVTKSGKIFSYKTNKYLKGKKDKDGYVEYCLSINNKQKYIRGHRIVLETFKNNIDNKATINHINGIKDDNRLDNLEWATYSENNYHRMRELGHGLDTAIKYIINDSETVSRSELKRRTSRQFVDMIDNNTQPLYFTILMNKDNMIDAYCNGELINTFKNNQEAADYYNVKKNTISAHKYKTLNKVQRFSLNNKVKRLA